MPEQNRDVWVLVRGYAPDEGGLETYGQALAQAYAALGMSVTVFTPTSIGPREFRDGAVRVIDVGAASQPVVMVRLLKAVRRELRSRRPAFVHAVTWRLSIPAVASGLGPLVISVHGREINFVRGPLKLAMIQLLRRASHIVAVSGSTAAQLAGVAPSVKNKVTVAWNGLTGWAESMPPRPERSPGPMRLLSLCRLAPRKNIPAAVDAVAACIPKGLDDFVYQIGGRGADSERVAERIAAQDLGGRVKMLGFVPDDDARRLFGEADIFIHPQIALAGGRDIEGFGITIADAMASGAVCVVGEAGGPRELIQDGVTGKVVDGHDHVALVEALAQLLADPAACRRMGEAAQAFAKAHFSWRRHAETVMGLVGATVPTAGE